MDAPSNLFEKGKAKTFCLPRRNILDRINLGTRLDTYVAPSKYLAENGPVELHVVDCFDRDDVIILHKPAATLENQHVGAVFKHHFGSVYDGKLVPNDDGKKEYAYPCRKCSDDRGQKQGVDPVKDAVGSRDADIGSRWLVHRIPSLSTNTPIGRISGQIRRALCDTINSHSTGLAQQVAS